MKIAIITDQHFGARNDSNLFLDYYEKFYTETFFPELVANSVEQVYILGDTFDHKKMYNAIKTSKMSQKDFTDQFSLDYVDKAEI